ncbi:MAG: ATP-binding protein, partial [Chloroflexota bacterium]|nr:ATP-binding protein [Chloroflexota bacterium]
NPQSGSFSFDALLVLTGIGSLAGSSIQNAQLFKDVQLAHNRYHDLFENSIDPIIITDLHGSILEINRQTILTSKFSSKILLGMSIIDIHKIHWEEVGEDFGNLKAGRECSYESFLRTQTGKAPPILVSVHPIQIDKKERWQWIFRDISERKKLDQLRDDLASMIYHDLRSPLANVISSLDVLDAALDIDDKPEVRSLFDIANRSTERIQRLTKSLLDVNRLEAGQQITHRKPASPQGIAQKAYEALVPIAHNKKQSITINMPEDLLPVLVDKDMIERVAINLLQNAIKYTPMEGEIEIGAHQEKEIVRFWVRDTGPGIEPQAQDAIFNKFTRLHPAGGAKGLGIGLAFCRLAVEGHDGRIWVENAPQGGSIFSFTLPIASQEKED